jgi:hypothetical protein
MYPTVEMVKKQSSLKGSPLLRQILAGSSCKDSFGSMCSLMGMVGKDLLSCIYELDIEEGTEPLDGRKMVSGPLI